MKVIGLSGGIASGKTMISNMIRNLGIQVIDSDIIARNIIEKGTNVLDEVVKVFGSCVLNDDCTLNRKKLGSIVFNDKNRLEELNKITHPAIKKSIIDNINDLKNSGEKYCVVDGALLMESVFTGIVDVLMLIYVNQDIQVKRLMEREKVDKNTANNIINSQMSFEEKKKYADFIIDNSYTVEYTEAQVNRIINEILLLED